MYTIQDTNGGFVDKHSIWYEKETGQWHYTSKGGYKFDSSMKNLDTGVILSKTMEEAEEVVKSLKSKLHKVSNNIKIDFTIIEV